MPSAKHEAFVAMISGGLGLEALSIDDQRAAMEASTGMFPTGADIVAKTVDAGGVEADWLSIDGATADGVILFLHGGGYTMGSKETHRGLAGRVAPAAKAHVLVPNYRLAPEHPFPAAVDDAVSCWHWLVTQGHAPGRMAIAGDSAGGGLTLATLLALKAVGKSMPACAVAMSPWLDLEGTGPTAAPGAVDDPMLTPEGLRESGRMYAGKELRNPLAAPLYGDLAGLPPLLLQVGTREILLSDSTRFAEKARAAGVEVTLEVEEGLIHVWQMLPGVPEAESAIERIGAFVERHRRDVAV